MFKFIKFNNYFTIVLINLSGFGLVFFKKNINSGPVYWPK